MKNGPSTEKRLLSNLHVTPQQHVIRENRSISHLPVMPDMTTRHQKTTVAHGRVRSRGRRPMNGNVFAERRVISNLHKRVEPRIEAQILWVAPDDRPRTNDAIRADNAMFLQNNMRSETSSVSDLDPLSNHGVRANKNILTQPGRRMNDCSGMNHRTRSGSS
jgi:hypothetical protein